MENASTTSGINSFNIPSDHNEEYLEAGQFNFTFVKNYETNHTLEDDTPLDYPKMRFTPDPTFMNGSSGDDAFIQTKDDGDSIQLNSAGLEITYNFTTEFAAVKSDYGSKLLVSNSSILGFNVLTNLKTSRNVTLEIYAFDHLDSDWDLVESRAIEDSTIFEELSFNIINKNSRYLDNSNNPEFSFLFTDAPAEFSCDLDWLSISGLEGEETPINVNEKVALEFDVKGDAQVHGFQAWIRAFNITEPEVTNLTIKLFGNLNVSTPVARSVLLDTQSSVQAIPNEAIVLAEISVIDYIGDEPLWFDLGSSVDLTVGNYFFEISSDATDGKGFTIVSIPYTAPEATYRDPQGKVDHLFLKYNTTGMTWEKVRSDFQPYVPYESKYESDAAFFAVNLTRAYLPEEIAITIENSPISNTFIQNYPHDEAGYYATPWWGYGIIDHQFTQAIKAEGLNFNIPLSKDTDLYTGDLEFSVDYSVEKYGDEAAITNYKLLDTETPEWNATYTFNPLASNFTHWSLTKFEFFVPADWTITDLNLPDYESLLANATILQDVDGFDILQISSETVNETAGDYILSATSPNYAEDLMLSLQYYDNLWASNGFMLDDNISVKFGLLENGNYLTNHGEATILLFGVDGVRDLSHTLSDLTIDSNDSTASWFNFDDENIFSGVDTKGEYTIIANWTNGEELGILKQTIYVNDYGVQLIKADYDPETKQNQIIGNINTFDTDTDTYDLFLYAISDLPEDTYQLNQTLDYGLGQDIYLTQISQNETVLNANEDINFIISLENRHTTLAFDITVSVQIVSYLDNDWIIMEDAIIQNLAISGDPSELDTFDFDISLTVPDELTGGINCPIRNTPMVMRLNIEVDGEEVYDTPQSDLLYYSSVAEAEFDGQVLKTHEYSNRIGPTFIGNLDRTDLQLPGNISYFIQIVNDYYMAMEFEENITQYYELDGQITDLAVDEDNLDHVSIVNLTGSVFDEYGEPLAFTEINLKYDKTPENDTYDWTPLITLENQSTVLTDVDGFFTIEIDLMQTPLDPKVLIQTLFAGNSTHLSLSEILTLDINKYENSAKIYIDSSVTIVEDDHNLITVSIMNTGNSTLENINVTLNSPIGSTLILADIATQTKLLAGQKYEFQIDFYDENIKFDAINITLTVTAGVAETGEELSIDETFELDIYKVNTDSLTRSLIVGGFAIGLILLWGMGALFIKKRVNEINTPVTTASDVEKSRSRRRTGKYVRVAELSIQEETEKIPEKAAGEPSEETTLDDLLDEN
jgi:hypothetical protein